MTNHVGDEHVPNGSGADDVTTVGVVGLGVVGGTLADALSAVGFEVRGYDSYRGIGEPAALAGCPVVFLCIPTSTDGAKGFDLSEVWGAMEVIAPELEPRAIVAVRSTVPPGTTAVLSDAYPTQRFVSAPEFLVADRALETLTHPDRTVIGSTSLEAGVTVARILGAVAPDAPLVFLSPTESELVKLCSNALLSAKVAMANELFEVCRVFGVEWSAIQDTIGRDRRIGGDHLSVTPERGFGGACLPKDLDGLVAASAGAGYDPHLLRGIAEFNRAVRSTAIVEIQMNDHPPEHLELQRRDGNGSTTPERRRPVGGRGASGPPSAT